MPKFFYIARDAAGNKVSSTEEAANQDELITRLQAKNLIVISAIAAEEPSVAVNKLVKGAGPNTKFKVRKFQPSR